MSTTAAGLAITLISAACLFFSGPSSLSGILQSPDNGDEGVQMDSEFWKEPYGDGNEFAIKDASGDELSHGQNSQLRSANLKESDKQESCEWSDCQGLTMLGQYVCDNHGDGYYYSGEYKRADCNWDASRSQCCKAKSNKKWGEKCWGMAYLPAYACHTEFGEGYVPTGSSKKCDDGVLMTRYECGN